MAEAAQKGAYDVNARMYPSSGLSQARGGPQLPAEPSWGAIDASDIEVGWSGVQTTKSDILNTMNKELGWSPGGADALGARVALENQIDVKSDNPID